jgi:putative ABC transport system permease protein
VAALYEPVVVFEGVLADLTKAEELGAAPGRDTAAYFTLADGADLGAVRAGIGEVVAANPALRVQDTAAVSQAYADGVRQLLALVLAMLAVAVVIAFLAILITLLLQVSERTSELGMLRAIGATRHQVRRMIAGEAAVLGLFGAVCGIALGAGYGVAMRIVMQPLGMTELALPWGWFLALGLGGAMAGVLAAVGPAIGASRLNVLRAIAVE